MVIVADGEERSIILMAVVGDSAVEDAAGELAAKALAFMLQVSAFGATNDGLRRQLRLSFTCCCYCAQVNTRSVTRWTDPITDWLAC
jgi:hypothetical protein